MGEKIGQHYIPKFYLRQFGISKGTKPIYQVFCFDKSLGQSYLVNVDKIAKENYFNNVDGTQAFEDALAKHESLVASSFHQLLKVEHLSELPLKDKTLIADMIATQHSRTRDARELIKEAYGHVALQLTNENMEVPSVIEKLTHEEFAKRFQYDLMAKTTSKFAILLMQMKWYLFHNQTSVPFWTSDKPLVYFNIFPYDKFDGLGYTRTGSELYFPLNAKMTLAIVDPRLYDGLSQDLDIEDAAEIMSFNERQVRNSRRYLFSLNSDFSLAEKIIAMEPDLGNIEKNRFQNEKIDWSKYL